MNFKVKQQPGLRLLTPMSAECASAMRFTIERPSPDPVEPRRSFRQNLWKICARSAGGMPGPSLANRHAAAGLYGDAYGRSLRSIANSVLGEVPEGPEQDFGVSADEHGHFGRFEENMLALRDG